MYLSIGLTLTLTCTINYVRVCVLCVVCVSVLCVCVDPRYFSQVGLVIIDATHLLSKDSQQTTLIYNAHSTVHFSSSISIYVSISIYLYMYIYIICTSILAIPLPPWIRRLAWWSSTRSTCLARSAVRSSKWSWAACATWPRRWDRQCGLSVSRPQWPTRPTSPTGDLAFTRYCFTAKLFCGSPFIAPPHQQSLLYCKTVARPSRNIRPPSNPPFVSRAPDSISNGNLVQRPTGDQTNN